MWDDEESSVIQCRNGLLETTQSLDQLQLHGPDQVFSSPEGKSKDKKCRELKFNQQGAKSNGMLSNYLDLYCPLVTRIGASTVAHVSLKYPVKDNIFTILYDV